MKNAGKFLSILGLLVVAPLGCIKSVCETHNDCPVGNLCSSGACIKPCTANVDCPGGRFCDVATGLCVAGCRSSSDCAGGGVCVQNQCWVLTSPASPTDGGLGDDGAVACSCLQAPGACLKDINPASTSAGTLVCEPGTPPRAAALFFGNVGCSHCQRIMGNLLRIESQLRAEGLAPTLAFVQLATFTHTGDQVATTFPTLTGPVLQDTADEDMWGLYGADWYQVKIIDSHGCLSAFFSSDDTEKLMYDGELPAVGTFIKDAWRSAMGTECHAMPDGGFPVEVGP